MALIGDALLGAAAGGGKVGAEGYLKEQEQQTSAYNAQNHARLLDQLTSAREERNARLGDQLARSRATEFEQPFQAKQQAERLTSEEARTAMTRESAEEVARINHANELTRIRLQQTLKERDAMKDLPASIKEFIGVQRERLKALDAAEANPMTDEATRAGIASQKAALADIIEQALTTKSIPARKPAAPAQPDPLGLRGSLPKKDAVQNRQRNQQGPQPAPEPSKPSGQRIYGPLTPESIIENDVKLGVPAALEYVKTREERRKRMAQRDSDRERELVTP